MATAAAGVAVVFRSCASNSDPSAPASPLTIGEVARRSGFSIKALRFYERCGLLPPSGRSPGGYRLYSEADLHRLDFIRQAKALGLALGQVRELVSAAREQSCSMMRPRLLGVLDERIGQAACQIATLTRLRKELERQRRVLARQPADRSRPRLLRVLYRRCAVHSGIRTPPQAGAAGKDESDQPNVFTSGEIQRGAGLIQRNLRWNFFWIALTGALFEFGAAFADAACRRSCTAPPSWA